MRQLLQHPNKHDALLLKVPWSSPMIPLLAG